MVLLPKTSYGKASVILIITMVALFLLGTSFVSRYGDTTSDTILKDITARPLLASSMLAAFASGIASFIIGFFAVVKKKERAILTYISSAIGGFLVILLIAELIFPH